MAELKTVERTKFQPDNLRAPESVITDYKKIGTENLKDLERQEYEVFAKRLRSDPVRVMLEASDLGMSLEQYANFRAPDTLMTQNRSVISRVMEDDGLFAQDSVLSASAPVDQFMDNGYRQAILYSILNKAWDGSALIAARAQCAITVKSSARHSARIPRHLARRRRSLRALL